MPMCAFRRVEVTLAYLPYVLTNLANQKRSGTLGSGWCSPDGMAKQPTSGDRERLDRPHAVPQHAARTPAKIAGMRWEAQRAACGR